MKRRNTRVMLLAASVMMCTLAFGSGAFAEDLPSVWRMAISEPGCK